MCGRMCGEASGRPQHELIPSKAHLGVAVRRRMEVACSTAYVALWVVEIGCMCEPWTSKHVPVAPMLSPRVEPYGGGVVALTGRKCNYRAATWPAESPSVLGMIGQGGRVNWVSGKRHKRGCKPLWGCDRANSPKRPGFCGGIVLTNLFPTRLIDRQRMDRED